MENNLNRINDAYQSTKSLENLTIEKDNLVKTIETAEKLLEDIQRDIPIDPKSLELFEIRNTSGYALRIRIRSILSLKRNRLQEVNSAIKQELDILQKITICPYCGGKGESIDYSYERFERRIHTTISTKKCDKCNGSGRISLGEEIEKMVQETLKKGR